MDIIFLSYEEPSAEGNFAILQERFPRAKRLHGVNGLGRAHRLTAQMADSDYYFIVDGDNEILPSFNFDAVETPKENNIILNWFSRNPVNGLEYPNGGVKLCSRQVMANHGDTDIDFIITGGHNLVTVKETASLNRFNTSEFDAWRAAFRECAKLQMDPDVSGFSIKNQDWISEKISIWTSVGRDQPYGDWVIRGAKDGVNYARKYSNDYNALLMINDSDWLKKKFITCYNFSKFGLRL